MPPANESQRQECFTLEILPSSSRSASRGNHLPPLLGLNALSLSLPSSGSFSQAASSGSAKASRSNGISKIIIQNLPRNQIHLLFSSPRLDTGVRSGFWLSVPLDDDGRDQKVCVRWDDDDEELQLCSETPSEDEADADVKVFDYRHLLVLKARVGAGAKLEDGVNSADTRKQEPESSQEELEWPSLTKYLTPTELDRIIPANKLLHLSTDNIQTRTRTWPVSTLSTSQTADESGSEQIQALNDEEQQLNLTPISFTRTFPPSSIGAERTKWARDRSWYLSSLVSQITPPPPPPPPPPSSTNPDINPNDPYGSPLLAELTLSFTLAMLLGNYTCLQHWKHILALTLTCTSAARDVEKHTFFIAFLHALTPQIIYLASGSDLGPGTSVDEAQPGPGPGQGQNQSSTTAVATAGGTANANANANALFDIHASSATGSTGADGDELHRLLRGFARGLADSHAYLSRLQIQSQTQSQQQSQSPDLDDATHPPQSLTALQAVTTALRTLSTAVDEKASLNWELQLDLPPSPHLPLDSDGGGDGGTTAARDPSTTTTARSTTTQSTDLKSARPSHEEGFIPAGLSRRLLRMREGFGDGDGDDFEYGGGGGLGGDGYQDEDADAELETGEFAPVVVDLDGSFAVLEDGEQDQGDEGGDGDEDEEEEEGGELEDLRY